MNQYDIPSRLWDFLIYIEYQKFERYVSEIYHHFQGYYDNRQETRNFWRFMRNRFFINIRRISGRTGTNGQISSLSDRQQSFIHQVQTISSTSSAIDIRFFMALMMMLKESGTVGAFLRNTSSSYWGGGLDNLYTNQTTYHEGGWLPQNINYAEGSHFGELNYETREDLTDRIMDARVPGSQILIAYAARMGYAASRVQQVIRNVQVTNPGWFSGFQYSPLVCQNVLIAVCAAAQGGQSASTWCPSGRAQGCGIRTVVQYLAINRLTVGSLYNIWNFDWPYGSGRRYPFRIQRIRAAINLAIAATALRDFYGK